MEKAVFAFRSNRASGIASVGRFDRVSRSVRTLIAVRCFLLIQKYFGCRSIRPDRTDKTLKYEVRCLDDLVERIIPFFEANPLISSKQRDFERFANVCRLVRAGAHRTQSGL